MKDKALTIGWILMLILGVYRLFAGIYLIAVTSVDLSSGIVFLTNAVAIIAITIWSYRKAEKWAWGTLLIIGIAPLISCLIQHGPLAWVIIGWIIFVPAVVIPVKAFFMRTTNI